MFTNMEDEIQIFVAWLKKYIKVDKKITGKALAGKIFCDPTTISSYIRKRTAPDFETRAKILEEVDVSYEKMIKDGKEALAKKEHPTLTESAIREIIEDETKKHKNPIPIDPAIEILQEVLLETGTNITPEIARKIASILKTALSEDDSQQNITPITKEHQEVIKAYQDKEEGLSANKNLLELEKLDPEEFYSITGKIRGKVKRLQQEKGLDQEATQANGTEGESSAKRG